MRNRFRGQRKTRRRGRRIGDVLVAALFFVLVAVAAAWLERQSEELIEGRATVVDGDTLRLEGRSVRLIGLDAPERDQMCHLAGENWPCGAEARRRLSALIVAPNLKCRGSQQDRYDRFLATCTTEDGDLGAGMVRAGLAIADGRYEGFESEARQAKRGIWAGSFEAPRDWRARNGLPDAGEITNWRADFRRLVDSVMVRTGEIWERVIGR